MGVGLPTRRYGLSVVPPELGKFNFACPPMFETWGYFQTVPPGTGNGKRSRQRAWLTVTFLSHTHSKRQYGTGLD